MRSAEASIVADKLYSYIGSKIKEARSIKHCTQQTLANKVGLTRTSINNIEHGRQKLLLDTLWQIASILDTPIMNLIPQPEEISISFVKAFPNGTPEDVKSWVINQLVEEEMV